MADAAGAGNGAGSGERGQTGEIHIGRRGSLRWMVPDWLFQPIGSVRSDKSKASGSDAGATESVADHKSMPQKKRSAATVLARRRWSCTRFILRSIGVASFEAKALNLVEECAIHAPGRVWSELDPKEQAEIIRRALEPGQLLVDPHCEFMKYWDLIVVVALVFTGIVTPYEVIFMGQVTFSDWLFWVNRCVDLTFILDMLLQFFLQVEVPRSGKRGTQVLKNPWQIRKRYLCGWFTIDFVSVQQFDILFLLYSNPGDIAGIKMLRCLRLIRLIKLARILKTSRLIMRWQNYFAISFATQKLMKFSFVLLLSSHWMACLWGVIGLNFGYELCDKNGPIVYAEDPPLEQISWVTTLFNGGKESPDDPCEPWHVYMASLHWSVMTITSIGYGDIVPVRNEEYITCIMCMLFGGVLWAYIIGSLCGLIANQDPVQTSFETNTDLVNSMLKDANVPKPQRQVFREYLREARTLGTMNQFREVASRFSPMLKGQLLMHFSSAWTQKVIYLKKAPERCIMDLHDVIEMSFFSRQEVLASVVECLCILERGTLAMGGKVLAPGSPFHTDVIVTNRRWRQGDQAVSLTHAMVMGITRDMLFEVASKYPEVEKTMKRAAITIALSRCVHALASLSRELSRTVDFSEFEAHRHLPSSIVQVFSLVLETEGSQVINGTATSNPEIKLTSNMLKRVATHGCDTIVSDSSSPRAQRTSGGTIVGCDSGTVGKRISQRSIHSALGKTSLDIAIESIEHSLAKTANAAQAQLTLMTDQIAMMKAVREEVVASARRASLRGTPCSVCANNTKDDDDYAEL